MPVKNSFQGNLLFQEKKTIIYFPYLEVLWKYDSVILSILLNCTNSVSTVSPQISKELCSNIHLLVNSLAIKTHFMQEMVVRFPDWPTKSSSKRVHPQGYIHTWAFITTRLLFWITDTVLMAKLGLIFTSFDTIIFQCYFHQYATSKRFFFFYFVF